MTLWVSSKIVFDIETLALPITILERPPGTKKAGLSPGFEQ